MAYHTRIKTIPMDFGGALCLQENGRWIYDRRSGDTRTVKSTRQREFAKAVEVARKMAACGKMSERHFGRAYESDFAESYNNTKKNASKRGIPFELTADDLHALVKRAGGRCELTGIAFQRVRGIGPYERQPFMPSIDRIDSQKGYTADNVRLLCTAANLAINTWGDWVLIEMSKALLSSHSALMRTAPRVE